MVMIIAFLLTFICLVWLSEQIAHGGPQQALNLDNVDANDGVILSFKLYSCRSSRLISSSPKLTKNLYLKKILHRPKLKRMTPIRQPMTRTQRLPSTRQWFSCSQAFYPTAFNIRGRRARTSSTRTFDGRRYRGR